MSLLSRLKQLFKKHQSNNKEKMEKEVEQASQDDMPIEVEKEPMPVIPARDNVSSMETTYNAIKSWEKTMEVAKQHPLSQVKIINTQILEELSNVLKQMNNKLDELSKLDEILMILHETKSELEEKGIESNKVDQAIEEIERLTIKDKEVVSWIVKQERVTANQLAGYTGLSRSTASFRLNRLAELGVLEKEAVGKKIYYKPKNI